MIGIASIRMRFLIGFFLLMGSQIGFAQAETDSFAMVYPKIPFSLEEMKKHGLQRITIWHDEFTKGPEDESGYNWSNSNGVSYQCQMHLFPDGILQKSSYYYPNGFKQKALEYYYRNSQIITIDELEFDSLDNGTVVYNYSYVYKGKQPFQSVKQFLKDKRFRTMTDYLFDKENRLVREQITTHGFAKKLETIVALDVDRLLVLYEYSGDTKTVRYYQNMHDLLRSERTQYNEYKLPINTRIKDGNHKLVEDITYSYEDGVLTKKTFMVPDGVQVRQSKVIYYTYNHYGLLDKEIIEQGDLQTIFTYQYSEEY